ncbi:hypothetical protein F0P96_19795 [Hymenobacter busanensis]|uniref:Uncharacterized protein n=1 Tax=Hymenobacter busanensis TaxID=2607656 RepID=A0A7L4ZY44_9BACT|nr:hypothetical protein [Hymenobacter busanensis]KAA9325573.1 hypothetical protein F0P96_19795 [Hymenobacter busanensis]QHJ07755.1 hypothetical protein GUY19_10870 [Hymenobacter busanensis]
MPYALKYATVFLLSMVKFIGGPVTGAAAGLSFAQTLALTVAGMMTSVAVVSGVGRSWAAHMQRRRRLRHKPVFSRRSRTIVRIFSRFGISGIAFLTPILFTPIGGTVIATMLGVRRQQILLHMFWSALLWGAAFTFLTLKFSHLGIFKH